MIIIQVFVHEKLFLFYYADRDELLLMLFVSSNIRIKFLFEIVIKNENLEKNPSIIFIIGGVLASISCCNVYSEKTHHEIINGAPKFDHF